MAIAEKANNSRLSRAELKDYLPPEVHDQGYTTASDIFAWGQLAIDVIRQGHFALVWEEDGQIRFPREFMSIIESCLANDPGARPTAARLTEMTREVAFDLMGRPETDIDWILGTTKCQRWRKDCRPHFNCRRNGFDRTERISEIPLWPRDYVTDTAESFG